MNLMAPRRRASRVLGLVAAVVAVSAAVLLYFVDPTRAGWLPKCPLHQLTGWHCPGCGSTRAAHALLHGDLRQALSFNALLVCAAPLAALAWLNGCVRRKRTLAEWTASVRPRWIWTIVAAGAAFAILRNVPWYPFEWLAPH